MVSHPSTVAPLGPDIPRIILLHDVLYTWHVFTQSAAAGAAAALCVAMLLVAAAGAAVRHRVADGKKMLLVH